MKLATRLWLYGALVPSLVLASGFVLVGVLLDRELRQAIDSSLLAQAAVESVSLFDKLDHAPHLHLDRSPLPDSVRLTSATGALYGPDGALLAHEPVAAAVPPTLRWPPERTQPHLQTQHTAEHDLRELIIAVRAPDGRPHTLRLAVSLQHHNATLAAYVKAAATTALLATLGLFALQLHHARAVHGRVMRLHSHMQRLHAGDLDATPAADAHGDVLTELREAIAAATERLRHARQAEERLLADAAHELRTPLAAMRADIDVTLRRERPPEALREALERSRGEVDRLAALATRLLDLAAQRHAQWLALRQDVVPLLRDGVAGVAAAAAEKGVVLHTLLPAELIAVVDAAALRQVLDNLLANALRFAESELTVRVEAAGARWQLHVADDGPGVPEPQRAAIFEPFHRPDKRGAGSGLGLAIVREVVQRQGGHVAVRDNLPHGAHFVVDLPLG